MIVTTYGSDGSFVSESRDRRPVARLERLLSSSAAAGRWRMAACVTRDVATRARALDGDTETDAMAKAGAELIDAMGHAEPAASEILRLDARRLTLRPAGVTDPPVIGCIRQTGAGPLVTGGDAT